MRPFRLLVAGSNEIERKGICALVREHTDWKIAAEARDGREAVQRIRQAKPDVAIMHIDMALLNGLDATRQITKGDLQTKVLLLAPHDTDQLLPQALEAGARVCLLKSDSADDLISAVEALRQGKSFLHNKGVARGSRRMCGEPKINGQVGRKDPRRLTPRQREVLQLLAEGHTNKEVGAVLKISTKTAETHRANLMHKIDCHSVVELVRYAIRTHISSI